MQFNKIILIISIFLSSRVFSIGPGDIALIEVAMNTLNSVRELNKIVSEQEAFNENFERVYQKVDQGIWKADRTALWLEDIKSLKDTRVENLNDFNSVLRRLKNETQSVKRNLVEKYNQRQETKRILKNSNKDQISNRRRIAKYSSESKSELSPHAAQVETARNTKDSLIETVRLNAKMGEMKKEITKMSLAIQLQEQRYLTKKIKDSKNLRQVKRGILTERDVQK